MARGMGVDQLTRTVEADARAHIVVLVVSTRARRSGLGRRLIAGVERCAATMDAEMVVVRRHIARREAHEFTQPRAMRS